MYCLIATSKWVFNVLCSPTYKSNQCRLNYLYVFQLMEMSKEPPNLNENYYACAIGNSLTVIKLIILKRPSVLLLWPFNCHCCLFNFYFSKLLSLLFLFFLPVSVISVLQSTLFKIWCQMVTCRRKIVLSETDIVSFLASYSSGFKKCLACMSPALCTFNQSWSYFWFGRHAFVVNENNWSLY
jgi:hypothetical protein